METNSQQPGEGPATSNGSREAGKAPTPESRIAWSGLAGVVVGALLAGGFSVGATLLQQQGDAATSKSDFLREQRLAVYGTYISNLERLQDAEDDLSNSFKPFSGPPSQSPDYSAGWASLESARKAVDLDQSKLRILCSEPVCESSIVVQNRHDKVHSQLINGALFGSSQGAFIEEANKYAEVIADAIVAQDSMVKAMQKELGVVQ